MFFLTLLAPICRMWGQKLRVCIRFAGESVAVTAKTLIILSYLRLGMRPTCFDTPSGKRQCLEEAKLQGRKLRKLRQPVDNALTCLCGFCFTGQAGSVAVHACCCALLGRAGLAAWAAGRPLSSQPSMLAKGTPCFRRPTLGPCRLVEQLVGPRPRLDSAGRPGAYNLGASTGGRRPATFTLFEFAACYYAMHACWRRLASSEFISFTDSDIHIGLRTKVFYIHTVCIHVCVFCIYMYFAVVNDTHRASMVRPGKYVCMAAYLNVAGDLYHYAKY